MKKISIIICIGLFSLTSTAQIKIDTKNIKKLKNAVNAVTDDNSGDKKKEEVNTNSNVETPNQTNNSNDQKIEIKESFARIWVIIYNEKISNEEHHSWCTKMLEFTVGRLHGNPNF